MDLESIFNQLQKQSSGGPGSLTAPTTNKKSRPDSYEEDNDYRGGKGSNHGGSKVSSRKSKGPVDGASSDEEEGEDFFKSSSAMKASI